MAECNIHERLTPAFPDHQLQNREYQTPLDGASCLAPLPLSGLHQPPRNLDDASRKC